MYLHSKNGVGRGIDAGFGKIKTRKGMLNNSGEFKLYLHSKNGVGRGIDAGFGKIKTRKGMLNNSKEEIYSG